MDKVILDTDILSEYLKGFNQNVVRHAKLYTDEFEQFTFSSVTVYEIIRGLEEKGATSQVSKALSWMKSNEQIVPTADDFLSAARIKARAKHQGRIVELPDCLIAASASRLNLILVTGNVTDYVAIQNSGLQLTVRNWRDT